VGQGDDLPGAADPAPGHGRDEAVVDPVDQERTELRPDPGVAAEQVPQPGHQHRPGLGRGQPRRPADRPAEQQVALVVGLAGGHPLQGRRGQGQLLAAPGHRLDRLPGQVAVPGQEDRWRTPVGPVWLGLEVDMVAPAGVCSDR
jgi:hypothetical protein